MAIQSLSCSSSSNFSKRKDDSDQNYHKRNKEDVTTVDEGQKIDQEYKRILAKYSKRILGHSSNEKRCDDGCDQYSCDKHGRCSQCKPRYYLDRDGCQQCQESYCTQCTSYSNCFDCEKGYQLMNGVCRKCNSSCLTCGSDPNQCSSCQKGQFLTPQLLCGQCPINSGYYPDMNSQKCLQCFSGCSSCNSAASDQCTECNSGYTFVPSMMNSKLGSCITCNTKNKQYLNSNSVCKDCHSSCQTCKGDSDKDCLSCENNKIFNEQNQCVFCDVSKATYFIENGTCKKCNTSCSTCSTQNTCTSCATPNSLYLGSCLDCTSIQGHYINPINQCVPCHPNCLSCSSGGENNCIQCQTGLYKFPNQTCQTCIVTQGYFIQGDSCLSCHASCQTCTDQNQNSCITCKYGLKLFEEQGIRQCILCDVNNGYYIDGNECKKCHATCQQCSASLTAAGQIIQCTKCQQNLYIKKANQNECQPCDISNGFYIQNQECLKCDSSCKQCTNQLSTDCLSCSQGYIKDALTNACVKCDQPGEFQDAQTNKCYRCNGNCKTCQASSLDKCTTCPENASLDQKNFTCVSCSLEDGMFIDRNKECKMCHFSCQKCTGCLVTDCISCKSGYGFDQLGKCIECKQENRLYLSLDGKCSQCHHSCQTCVGDAKNCLQCAGNAQLVNGSCPALCSNSEYLYNDGTCKPCNSNCQLCRGDQDTDCDLCNDDLKFIYNQNNQLVCGKCEEDQGYFVRYQYCTKCSAACKTCDGPNDNNCKSCHLGEYIGVDGKCTKCSNSGEYANQITLKCEKCAHNCQQCNGPNNLDCQKCNDQLSFGFTNECIFCDVQNAYFIDANNSCRKCHYTCEQCFGETKQDCSKCHQNQYFSSSNECIDCQTQDGFYIKKNECKKCQEFCKVCQSSNSPSSTESECRECQKGYYLFQGQCILCDTFNGYYLFQNTCLKCNHTCKTCTGQNENNCNSCNDGLFLFDDGTCRSCPSDLFFMKDGQCLKCHPNCKTCSGEKENQCLQCVDKNHYINEKTHLCQDCLLDQGYFLDQSICKRCHASCLTCNNSSDKSCLTCQSPQLLFSNSSCGSCPIDKFYVVKNKCLECNQSCKRCNGVTLFDCIDCQDGYGFTADRRCLSCTSIGQFLNSKTGQCQKCPDNCINCTDQQNGSDYTCKQCKTGYAIDELTKECVICNTSQGYYLQGEYCKKCHSTCKTCNSNGNQACIECKEPFKKHPDQTCSECSEDGHYFDKAQNICYDCTVGCKRCSTKDTCNSCQSGLYLHEQTTNCNSCDLSLGYIVSGNYCIKCHPSCKTCSNSFDQCQTCPDGFFIRDNSSLCQPCPNEEGYFIGKNGKCSYCYNLKGFEYNSTSLMCEEVCGKGFINQEDISAYPNAISKIQCDDGNLKRNDGCSHHCRIEKGFACNLIQNENGEQKTECERVKSGAIPKLHIQRDITQLGDTFLIKGVIKFDRHVKVLEYKQWEVTLLDGQDTIFSNFTYEIVPIKSETDLLQDQQFEIFLRLKQNVTGMNVNLFFPELSNVIDSENIGLSKDQVKGTLPDIVIKENNERNEETNQKYLTSQNKKVSEFSNSISIVFGCMMTLFFVSGKLYYIVHFYDLLQYVHYLVYLNIPYPYFLNQILHMFGFANFEIIPNIKNSLSNSPIKFNLQSIDTLLFHNITQLLSIWFFSIVLYMISRAVSQSNKRSKLIKYMKIYKNNYLYNIVIGLGIITYQEILLAALLQVYEFERSELIYVIASAVACVFLAICGLFMYSILNHGLLKPQQAHFSIFYNWNLKNKYNFLYLAIMLRKTFMIFIIVFGKAGITQCLTLHLILGIETVIIMVQKPFSLDFEYKFQIAKRVLLLFIITFITFISYDEENLEVLNIQSTPLSIFTSITLIVFLLAHVLYFIRSIYYACLKRQQQSVFVKKIGF